MKISSSFDNTCNRNCNSFKGIPANPKYIPEVIGHVGKVVGDYVNVPEQKLFLATSALLFQPFIDLKFADEDKKVDSAIKSASKAIAGGLTGVTIRALFLKLTDKFIGYEDDIITSASQSLQKKPTKLNRYLFPDAVNEYAKSDPALAMLHMKQYSKTLGTLFAVLFMILFSNSKLDVPITNDLQDLIGGVVKENKSWLKSLSDVKNNRTEKIKKWFENKKNRISNLNGKIKEVFNILGKDSVNKSNGKDES